MTRHLIEPVPLLFPHEHTDLFTAVRELHMYGVMLERNVGPTRAITLLSTAAFHAMSNIAAAGVAPTEKSQNLYLERVRRQLARCAMSIIALRDRGVIERDSTLFGLRLVDRALEAADEFRLELEVIRSMKPSTDPRPPLSAEARASAEAERQATVPSAAARGTETQIKHGTGAKPAGSPSTGPQLVRLPDAPGGDDRPGGTPPGLRPRADQRKGKDGGDDGKKN